MKKYLRFFLSTSIVIGILSLIAYLTGYRYLFSAIRHNFPTINDYKIFANRRIKKSKKPQAWKISNEYNKVALSDSLRGKLEQLDSIAFLIIKDDAIVYEEYWGKYHKASISNSFSMAKTYVSVLTGIALKQGHLKSLDQFVSEFIPEFEHDERKNITIRHLITMSSGLDWKESHLNPFSITTRGYYGDDIVETCLSLRYEQDPGTHFEYKSGDTQLLAMVLEVATGMNLSKNMEKNLWGPIGAEHNALWSLDKTKGTEKAYCCLNSNARDFARLGKLFLHKGKWGDNIILDEQFVKESLEVAPLIDRETGEASDFYGYSWWLIPEYKGQKVFYARGILGQFIICLPKKNIIIVRLGHKRGTKNGAHYKEIYNMVDEVLEKY
jgi:CubicO group peptidase (beta-lactamase class C family)